MKTPPERSGITFEVGAQLEARDRHKNWSEPQTQIFRHACSVMLYKLQQSFAISVES